ncbi:MAG: hypothetical protein ABI833_04480 [Acidobacteriota bacterium]
MTRRMSFRIGLLWSASIASLWAIDLASVQREPNLERRSQFAMEYANSALDTAQTAYRANEMDKTRASLDEAGEAVKLAYSSLKETGKNARRDPKYFKRTELSTRKMLRRIEGMTESMSFEDRPLTKKLREQVAAVHDSLLQDIMSKRK